MTESEILALIYRNIASFKQVRMEILASNRIANYQSYPIETMNEYTRTIKISIETLETLVSQIIATGKLQPSLDTSKWWCPFGHTTYQDDCWGCKY